MRKSRIIIISILCVIFLITALYAFSSSAYEFEKSVQIFLNPSAQSSMLFKFFTDLGEATGVISIILIFIIIPFTRKDVGLPLSITVTLSLLLSRVLKVIVARQRPTETLLSVSGYSFPSGHAMNNAALYIGILFFAISLCKTKKQKFILSTACIIMTSMIGVSRVYFNVHYLSDVICGWCLGSIIAVVTSEVYYNLSKKRSVSDGADKS